MEITVINLKFQVDSPIIFRSFSGFASRGLFYELLKRVDESYAKDLHSSMRLASFSATPIFCLGSEKTRVVYRVLRQGSLCMLRFVVFDEKLARFVLDALLHEDEPIRLLDTKVSLLEVSISQKEYSRFLEEAKPVKRMVVEFLTPTFFRFSPLVASALFPSRRLGGGVSENRIRGARRFHPLPEPVLMMRSLTRIWRMFSDKPFSFSDYLSWVSSMGLSLAGYPGGIRTKRLYEHVTTKKFVVGFVGNVNFSIPEDLYVKKWAKITDALLRFAEYSNVGGGRTAGFGMVKYLPKEYYTS